MKGKILSAILVMVVVISMMPIFAVPAFAAKIPQGADLLDTSETIWYLLTAKGTEPETYTLEIGGEGAMPNYNNLGLKLPEYYGEYYDKVTELVIDEGVTAIGEDAFTGFSKITRITLPESLTKICAKAFNGCTAVQELYIKSMTDWFNMEINCSPFGASADSGVQTRLYVGNDEITDVEIPSTVKHIKARTFDGFNGITEITLHDGIESIGDFAFGSCEAFSGKTFYMPQALKQIGNSAFDKLKNATVIIGNPEAVSVGPNNFDSSTTVIVQDELLGDYNGSLGSASVKGAYFVRLAEIRGGSVTADTDFIIKENYDSQIVSLDVEPDADCVLKSISVLYNNGVSSLTPDQDSVDTEKYTFTMPESSVEIYAAFENEWWSALAAAMNGTENVANSKFKAVYDVAKETMTVTLLKTLHAGNFDSEISIEAGKSVVLNLNGQSLDAAGTAVSNRRAFNIEGNLTVKDSSGKGRITGGYSTDGGAIAVNDGGSVVLESGNLCENFASNGGGAIACDGGMCTIKGGSVYNNRADFGGAVSLCGGARLLMTGGKIYNNEAITAGGSAIKTQVAISDAEPAYAEITGGDIYDNTSNNSTASAKNDKAIRVADSELMVASGSAVWTEGPLVLGGTVKIHDNKQGEYNASEGKWSDLNVANLAIKGAYNYSEIGEISVSVEKPLASGANIHLTQSSESSALKALKGDTELTDYGIANTNGFSSANIKYFRIDNLTGDNSYKIVAGKDENEGKFFTAASTSSDDKGGGGDSGGGSGKSGGSDKGGGSGKGGTGEAAAETDKSEQEQTKTGETEVGDGALSADAFYDITKDSWYYDAVQYCVANGIMKGKGAAYFDPESKLKRNEFVTMLWRMAGSPKANYTISFSDVNPNTYYAEAVRWAAAEGITSGYGESFAPEDMITREQFATMLYRYAGKLGKGFTGDWYFLLPFADKAEISSYADEAVHWCYMNKIVNGRDGNVFAPSDETSRAEAAAILQRFCSLMAEK